MLIIAKISPIFLRFADKGLYTFSISTASKFSVLSAFSSGIPVSSAFTSESDEKNPPFLK